MSPSLVVWICRGADQRSVGQRLGKFPLLLSGAADLLGIQAEVVGVGEHLLERQPRLVQALGAGSASRKYGWQQMVGVTTSFARCRSGLVM